MRESGALGRAQLFSGSVSLLLSCCVLLVGVSPERAWAQATLSPGGRVEGDAAASPGSVTLAVEAGHAVQLQIEGVNLRLELKSSDGQTIRRWEQWPYPCERMTPLRLLWVAAVSERILLEINPLDGDSPAHYKVEWTRHEPASRSDREWDRALSLVGTARLAMEAGDAAGALDSAREAAKILQSMGPKDPAACKTLEVLAQLSWTDDWELSRSLLGTSAQWRQSIQGDGHPCLAETLSLTATLLKEHGVWDGALDAERRALEIRRSALGPKHPDVGLSLYTLGVILEAEARLRESEENLRAALEIFEASPELEALTPNLLQLLGEVLRQQNQWTEAGELFKRALGLAERRMAPDDPALPRIMTSLAGFYRDQGELMAAEQWTRRSLELKRQGASNPLWLANGTLNLAEILRLQARYDEAEPLYLDALREARGWMAQSSPELVWFINQAAKFYQETDRPQRALELFQEAAGLLGGLPEHPLLAQTLHDLAGLQLELGDRDSARRNAVRALEIREKALAPDHPDVAASLTLLARVGGLEEGQDARRLLDRAVGILKQAPIYPDVQMEALSLRARIRRAEGEKAEAVSDLVAALEILEELRALRGGGELSRAALLAERLDDFHRLARWHFQDGRPADAVEALERHRSREFLDRVRLAGLDLEESIPADVLKPLREEEKELRARIAGYQQRIQRLFESPSGRSEIGGLSEELRRTLQAYRQIQERIRNASPLWTERLSRSSQTASLQDIQSRLLADGELMLIYEIGTRDSFVALIPAGDGDLRVFDLIVGREESASLGLPEGPLTAAGLEEVLVGRGPASILGQVGDPQSALAEVEGFAGYDSGPLLRRLNALWKVLAPPEAWSRLNKADGVVVIPDGALHQLPFEALAVAAGPTSRETRFWLDEGPAVRYSPSASVLSSIRDRASQRVAPRREPSILSVSNPSFGESGGSSDRRAAGGELKLRYVGVGGSLEPLPGTARETTALVDAFGAGRVQILEAGEATEDLVRKALPGKRILHLATHGIVGEEENDLLASLAFTPPAASAAPAENDGFLQLFEIYRLSLDADLTALSACETNLGRRVAGEGVFALSSGFLVAGSSRVLASQWRVDDESSARLVGSFFHAVAESERSGGDVRYSRLLRDAKRAVRKAPGGAPPYFWAPFVLAGLN